ncbi:glycolate oxidase [Desulfonispora thiosulfatigenes DSM 11270]|uniref:Glycolate oxidase n=1 Tax=Desulfonispora thiosulfatigenes DSM 11270 TaxID=656914 RepID=A0A1W1VMD1_DESTI|nr:FAD-linked oxidase C-terminal domain-containing protein [Desulfonispora thiosulfatigenes]SMB94380.1 glycolate oxidase [Desulfonispora thiosulfatigenes DSM 11270]
MITKEILNKLVKILGKNSVLTSDVDLVSYSYDATADMPIQKPDVVVIPDSKEQIIEIVKLADQNNIPIYTRGSGTNLCGDTIPVKGGIVLSTLKLNKIVKIDAENLTATVEPGLVIQRLNEAIEPYGLIYPPDPGTVNTATMGGSVSECSGGLRGLKYGVTKDYIMGLEIVMPNGDLIKTGGQTVKNVTGYDLTKLFTGAEGTLGIITKIIVKLIPAPEFRRGMLAVFDDIDKAGDTIADIIKNKVIPATMEIMDNVTIRTVENYSKVGLPVDAEAVLLLEVDGIKEVVLKEAEIVETICKKNGAIDFTIAKTDEEREKVWAARRAALPALAQVKPTTVLEDATVPRSEIPKMLKALKEIAKKYDLQIGTFGHAGDGNLHPTILTDASDKEEMKRVHLAVDEIFKVAISLGGTLSGEHGIGLAKAKYMEWEYGKEGVEVMRKIKKALDPNGILNPGKFV